MKKETQFALGLSAFNGNTALKLAKNVFLSGITAIAFCIDFSMGIKNGFPAGRFLLLVLSLSVIFFYAEIKDNSRGFPLISAAVSFMWLLSVSYINAASAELVFHQKIKAGIYFAGMTICINRLFKLLHFFLQNNLRIESVKSRKKFGWIEFFILLLLVYLPHVIVCYPGYTCIDSQNQIGQFFGFWPITSHHPVISTYVMGWCVKAGILLFNNANIGLYFYVVFQYVVVTAVMAYALSEIKNSYNSSNSFVALSFLIIAVSPYFTNYVCTVVKDTLYSAFSVLFLIELLHLLSFTDEFFLSNRHRILMAISVVGITLFRNNGKYVVILMLLVLAVFLKKKKRLHQIGIVFFSAIISIVICFAINSDRRIEKGSIREVLPFFIQQTARYAVYNPEDVTENERDVLNSVCDYSILPQRYNPMISDAAKDCFKYNITKSDLINYFQVWVAQGFRHPTTYFGAFFNQNFALVYPFYLNVMLFDRTAYENQYDKSFKALGIRNYDQFTHLQEAILKANTALLACPVVGLLSNLAVDVLIFIGTLLFAVQNKQKRIIIASTFFLIQIVMIAAGPTLIWGARYGLPIFYSMPAFMAFSRWRFSIEKGTAVR